jgi:transposase
LAWFAVTRPKSRTLPEYPLSSEPVEKVEQLLRARRGVVQALMSLRQQLAELPFAAAPLEAAIGALTAQRDQLDADIAAATQVVAPTDVKRLQAIVGVGPVTAHAVAARLAGRSFAKADQFVAYVGLDVATCESGKRKGERGLTKRGDAELRRLFYLCAQSAVRSRESPFRAHYEAELAKGRSKTAAACIIARKIAKLCWSLVKHQDEYRPGRVYEPADPPKAKGGSA